MPTSRFTQHKAAHLGDKTYHDWSTAVSIYLSRVQAHKSGRAYFVAVLQMGCLLQLSACAQRVGDRDAAFRRIQVHEAEVARGQAALASADDCTIETHSRAICDAARSVCEISSELGDRDATARCLQAGAACDGSRARAHASCPHRELR